MWHKHRPKELNTLSSEVNKSSAQDEVFKKLRVTGFEIGKKAKQELEKELEALFIAEANKLGRDLTPDEKKKIIKKEKKKKLGQLLRENLSGLFPSEEN